MPTKKNSFMADLTQIYKVTKDIRKHIKKFKIIAEAYEIPVPCHNTQPILSTVAHAHFVAATEIAVYEQEYNIEHISIRDDYPILKEPLNIKNGFMEIPNKPGLGVELDMKMVEKLSS